VDHGNSLGSLPLFDPPHHDSCVLIYESIQALIFVTRSRSWSFVERPGFLLVFAFLVAQLVSPSESSFTPYCHVVFLGFVFLTLCHVSVYVPCLFMCICCEIAAKASTDDVPTYQDC
jgi:hypothetical protein